MRLEKKIVGNPNHLCHAGCLPKVITYLKSKRIFFLFALHMRIKSI